MAPLSDTKNRTDGLSKDRNVQGNVAKFDGGRDSVVITRQSNNVSWCSDRRQRLTLSVSPTIVPSLNGVRYSIPADNEMRSKLTQAPH